MIHGPARHRSQGTHPPHFPFAQALAQTHQVPGSAAAVRTDDRHPDLSSHTYVLRRLLAQKLLDSPRSLQAVAAALELDAPTQAAAVTVLLHCSKQNMALCHATRRTLSLPLLLRLPLANAQTQVRTLHLARLYLP